MMNNHLNQVTKMAFKTIPISYIYAEPIYWERYETAREASGWSKATMLTQLAHTFGKVHLTYYQKAAELDAVARGYACHQGDHYDLLRNWDELPVYKGELPDFDKSPLQLMPDPDMSLERKSFTRFKCSGRNAAVLRMAMIVDRTNVQVLMTKILRWYYTNYWGNAYLSQIEANAQHTLNPDMEHIR